MNIQNKTNYVISVLLLVVAMLSCKKFVELPAPETQLTQDNVYASDDAATSAVLGMYNEMIKNQQFADGAFGVSLLGGLLADELNNFSPDVNQVEFSKNTLRQNNQTIGQWWQFLYKYIYHANAILEGINASTAISASVKQQLEGEALFVRAFSYFYLVNLFGDVPLVLDTDYKKNSTVSRAPKQQVYEQIITDLQKSAALLNEEYLSATNLPAAERSRPNKWAATALLSRVYLYLKDWANAEAQATEVIDQMSKYSLAVPLSDVFLANSQEAIWQLQPTAAGYNTFTGSILILNYGPNEFYNTFSLTDTLQKRFENGDQRKSEWIRMYNDGLQDYYYAYKYKVDFSSNISEYLMVLRLAEQYLIRSEARAQQDKITDAQNDINAIRDRAGLDPIIANNKTDLLAAIMHERQVELFTEWGHRWFDLKRTQAANDVLAGIKGTDWQATDTLMPLPQTEMQNNPNLTPQNSGY